MTGMKTPTMAIVTSQRFPKTGEAWRWTVHREDDQVLGDIISRNIHPICDKNCPILIVDSQLSSCTTSQIDFKFLLTTTHLQFIEDSVAFSCPSMFLQFIPSSIYTGTLILHRQHNCSPLPYTWPLPFHCHLPPYSYTSTLPPNSLPTHHNHLHKYMASSRRPKLASVHPTFSSLHRINTLQPH